MPDRLPGPRDDPARWSARLALRRENLAGLQGLLEAFEMLSDLLLGILAEHPRQRGSEATGGPIAERDTDEGPPAAGSRLKADRSIVLDRRTGKRSPDDQLAGLLRGDLAIPLD